MSAKQKALRLIEHSVRLYRELVSSPPEGYLKWNDRQHAAGAPLDQAHTLWRNMTGRDQAEVRDAWAGAHVQIERMLDADGAVDESDEGDGYEQVEMDEAEPDVDDSVASTKSDSQKALDLIETSIQGYRDLVKGPPTDSEDFRVARGRADALMDDAATIMSRLRGQDYREVAAAFGNGHAAVARLIPKIGATGNDEEDLEPTESEDAAEVDEDDGYQQVEVDEAELDVDASVASTMSDKQKALKLIEASVEGYRDLVRNPPRDSDDHKKRKSKADGQQADADTIMRQLTGSDYRTVVDRFSPANYEIEQLDAEIRIPHTGEDADDDPDAVGHDEPEAVVSDASAPGDTRSSPSTTRKTAKQKVLELSEVAVQRYRDLLKNPPKDYSDYAHRKQAADETLAAADMLVRAISGADYREALEAFRAAYFAIEEMDRKIGKAGNDEEDPELAESDDSTWLDEDEPRVEEEEPEGVLDQDDRAYMYSTLVHDPFDGQPDTDSTEPAQ